MGTTGSRCQISLIVYCGTASWFSVYGSENPSIAEGAMIQNQLPQKELVRSRWTDKINFTLIRKLRQKLCYLD